MDGHVPGEGSRGELSSLWTRVDLLTEEVRSAKRPWYKDVATLISIGALVFSLGTTVVAGWHTQEQDTHNLRTELRGLLQRLAAMPKEAIEDNEKYKNNPGALTAILRNQNQENVILSRQADELLRRLPRDQVSATDYIAVAGALANSSIFDGAIADLNRALVVASPVLADELGAVRNLAMLEMTLGKTGDARTHFQQAADIFGKDPYQGYDQVTKLMANADTEILWATAEGTAGNPDLFQQHLNKAEQFANSLPRGPQAEFMKANIAQVRSGQPPTLPAHLELPPPPAPHQ
jgi:tetratricopeptide (TPR) repeat protein